MIEAPRPGLNVRIVDVHETPDRDPPDPPRRRLRRSTAGGRRQRQRRRAPARVPYADLFNQAVAKYGVRRRRCSSAVAKQESGYNPRAVSPAGAQGLMQLMPATARASA